MVHSVGAVKRCVNRAKSVGNSGKHTTYDMISAANVFRCNLISMGIESGYTSNDIPMSDKGDVRTPPASDGGDSDTSDSSDSSRSSDEAGGAAADDRLHVLEPPTRFSSSCIWRAQREFCTCVLRGVASVGPPRGFGCVLGRAR